MYLAPIHTSGGARALWTSLLWLCCILSVPPELFAQETGQNGPKIQGPPSRASASKAVEVTQETPDQKIADRLRRIYRATGWFETLDVQVNEGVVFLAGISGNEKHREWAASLANETEGVVSVVNQITLKEPPIFDFTPALKELNDLGRTIIKGMPWIGVAAAILVLAWLFARICKFLTRRLLKDRIFAPLLIDVAAYAAYILVIIFGVYLVLRIAGLTRLAATVIGGTGLLGLVLGIAFRDITENFLASVFLSLYRPFRVGDLIEVEGELGYVQLLNTRSTVLMTLNGSHLQIPNAAMFKTTIRNFSTNPNRREDFTIGIGYEDHIQKAQNVALEVLSGHPAVLKDPAPLVLADSLGPSTVNLRIYFWLAGDKHSWLKVRSSVIRLIKRAFQDRQISMPDPERELIFPKGVAVTLQKFNGAPRSQEEKPQLTAQEPLTSGGEGTLNSEAAQLSEQARAARRPEEGTATLQLDVEHPSSEEQKKQSHDNI